MDQEWELARIPDQGIRLPMQLPEYNTRISKFSGVRTLTLFFPDNFTNDEDEPTRLDFIGLKGEFTAVSEVLNAWGSYNDVDERRILYCKMHTC